MFRPVTGWMHCVFVLSIFIGVLADDSTGTGGGGVSNITRASSSDHESLSNTSKISNGDGRIQTFDDNAESHQNVSEGLNSTDRIISNEVQLYRRLFRQKRESQKEAVKIIVSMESYEKQDKMIKMILTKLFTVLLQSKVRLTEAGYTPGDPFPTTDDIKDALSMVLENTAFVGDILLRLPDATHDLLNANREWTLLVEWAVRFSNDTSIFEGSDALLLETIAQEMNMVERNPDYINPYRRDILEKTKQADREVDMMVAEAIKKAKRERERKEKRKNKGPRMTSAKRDEL